MIIDYGDNTRPLGARDSRVRNPDVAAGITRLNDSKQLLERVLLNVAAARLACQAGNAPDLEVEVLALDAKVNELLIQLGVAAEHMRTRAVGA